MVLQCWRWLRSRSRCGSSCFQIGSRGPWVCQGSLELLEGSGVSCSAVVLGGSQAVLAWF